MDGTKCEVRGCTAAVEVIHLGAPLCDRHWKARAKAEARPETESIETTQEPAGEPGTTEVAMATKKTTKKSATKKAPAAKTAKTERAPKAARAAQPKPAAPGERPSFPEPQTASGDLMTFAVRLTHGESAAIHAAAGPGRASKFARAALAAAAQGDMERLAQVVAAVKAQHAAR